MKRITNTTHIFALFFFSVRRSQLATKGNSQLEPLVKIAHTSS